MNVPAVLRETKMRRSLLSKKSAWGGIACLDLLGAPSSFSPGIQRFTLHSNRGRLSSTWDPSPRVRCFHYPVASLCFSSNAPFKSAGNLTNEQRCEQGGWVGRGVGARTAPHTHTHPVPFTAARPAVVHLSSLTPCPHARSAPACLKVKQVRRTLNTHSPMHMDAQT